MKALLLFLSLAGFSAVVQAEIANRVSVQQPVCYGRDYNQAHMDAHPLQSVQQLRLMFYRLPEAPESLLMDVRAKLLRPASGSAKSGPTKILKNFKAEMMCNENGNSLKCFIDCDGGSAEVRWNVRNVGQEISFENQGFVLEGGCGDERELVILEPHQGGDDIFNLSAMPVASCRR